LPRRVVACFEYTSGFGRSCTGYSTNKAWLRERLSLFSSSYYVAGNGCNGTCSAGGTLRCGKRHQCKQSSGGKRRISYFRYHLALLLEGRLPLFLLDALLNLIVSGVEQLGRSLQPERYAGMLSSCSVGMYGLRKNAFPIAPLRSRRQSASYAGVSNQVAIPAVETIVFGEYGLIVPAVIR
jgi:hypothetical protein